MFTSFLLDFGAILLLLFLPGLVWNSLRPARGLSAPWLPIPGIVVLALFGLLFWSTPADHTGTIRSVLVGVYAGSLVVLAFRAATARCRPKFGPYEALALSIYALVLMQAVAIGVNPLSIAQEAGLKGAHPGRMIASPPDHAIPYQTAVYFYEHLDGHQEADRFGDWGLTARGPLVPLAINTLLQTFDGHDRKKNRRNAWPMSKRGEHLARALGWALNSLVVLGAYALLSALGVGRGAVVAGLSWLALSPIVSINIVYTWPKLLATYFVLLAVASIIRRRMALAGGIMGLAWLSHPVGALLIPAVGLFAVLAAPTDKTGNRLMGRVRFVAPAAIVGAFAMSPWLAFKLYLGQRDPFLLYLMGGGRGLEPASSFRTWLQVRIDNVWYTLLPFVFYFDGHMKTWLYGPLNDALRWLIQYAKSLPGHLGFSCFIPAYLSLFARSEDPFFRPYRAALLFGSFATMVLFWGFSADGLGRNALEPLSVLLIIFATAYFPLTQRWLCFALPILAIEGQALQIGGFVLVESFAWEDVGPSSWLCWLSSLAVSAALLVLFYASRKRTTPIEAPSDP